MAEIAAEFAPGSPPMDQGTGTIFSMSAKKLSHLLTLESESIYILREAAAEFARAVMLYSIGKDSSVMLRLAQKAFYPGKIPFAPLHIDTNYKFPELIEFRDRHPKEIGAVLIVHQNREALDRFDALGLHPFGLVDTSLLTQIIIRVRRCIHFQVQGELQ